MVKIDVVLEHMLRHPPPRCHTKLSLKFDGNTFSPPIANLAIHESVDDDLRHATQPQCMHITLEQTTPWIVTAHLNSLKYGDDSVCSIPGHILLKWLMQYTESRLINTIELTDASTTNIGGVNVSLQLFRKFCTGQSWYEQYGFLPSQKHASWAFQRSFDVVRRAKIHVVGSFLWLVLQPFIRLKDDKLQVEFDQYDKSAKQAQKITKVVEACQGPLSCLAYHTVSQRSLVQTLRNLKPDQMLRLWRFLQMIGLSKKAVCISKDTLQLKESLRNDTYKTKCFSTLAPAREVLDRIMNTKQRGEKNEVKNYIENLHEVLVMLVDLGVLHTTRHFEYKRTNRTPKRLVSRCRTPQRCRH